MPIRRRLAVAAGLCATALVVTACGSGDKGVTVQGAKLVKKGAITTCTHMPYPPFQSPQGGKVVGFDVDLIDLVAKKLGVTQKIIDTPFETIKTGSALNAGKCDVAAAGMTITADRAKFIDYSKPYFDATQAVMTRKGITYASVEDLKAKKIKIGAQAQTTSEEFLQGKGVDPKSYKDAESLLNGLRSAQVDAIMADYPVVQGWLKDPANAKFGLAANIHTGEQLGYAVRKGHNPKLLAIINQVIDQAKQDGTYKKIYEKWIGPLPAGS
ncbi:substrate-binding periplasmic protein [Actinoallomurus iriomotensis]|uniref:Basic amino acid ABC transporter substrate-binding protein n=1 Tax=Actinoallomurus iriomotensis TaxID=478107 RepID=A0A9W6VN43_9ACTN|nr:ABC transporter substrate-binding protein [Actinoallomurus iriomotensis]GLY72171.1 basic amino acid ABC transporter substrate-binding protein [Actinoallomurus iriomotensis]